MANSTENERILDFTTLESPPTLKDESYIAESKSIDVILENKTLKVYVEEVIPNNGIRPSADILFLHGMRFTSKNWLDIKSLHHVANWGYRGVAVDLPGYGKSINILEPEGNANFMKSLIATLGLHRPIIVSPSMSGGFSLPYIFDDPTTSTERSEAFIPVAPVSTSQFISQFKKSEIPTLILVGTNDTVNGKESTKDLKHLRNNWYAPIEGASHPCYLDNPDAFHRLLYHFLKQLKV